MISLLRIAGCVLLAFLCSPTCCHCCNTDKQNVYIKAHHRMHSTYIYYAMYGRVIFVEGRGNLNIYYIAIRCACLQSISSGKFHLLHLSVAFQRSTFKSGLRTRNFHMEKWRWNGTINIHELFQGYLALWIVENYGSIKPSPWMILISYHRKPSFFSVLIFVCLFYCACKCIHTNGIVYYMD